MAALFICITALLLATIRSQIVSAVFLLVVLLVTVV